MQHEENGGGVQTQESMDNAHNDHNTLVFTSFTDLIMVVSIVLFFQIYRINY